MLTYDELADFLVCTLTERKAQEIAVLDVRKLTYLTDLMLVATGTSRRHVVAVTEFLVQEAKRYKLSILGVEGKERADWVLVDLGDALVHVMRASVRDFYQLERLWTPMSSEEHAM